VKQWLGDDCTGCLYEIDRSLLDSSKRWKAWSDDVKEEGMRWVDNGREGS
jgi:hypothetical protein